MSSRKTWFRHFGKGISWTMNQRNRVASLRFGAEEYTRVKEPAAGQGRARQLGERRAQADVHVREIFLVD